MHGLTASLLTMAAWLPGHAGGVFYNSNQSAEYIRSFNLSNQTILQWATVRTLGNPALGDRDYESRNPVWLLPNFYAAYSGERWAVFTAPEAAGATAVRRWPDGLPSLDLAVKQSAGYGGAYSGLIGADAYAAAIAAGAGPARAQAAAAAAGLDAASFPSHSWVKGSSCFLAWRHGGAYRFSPRFALALAGRLVWARQDLSGSVNGACTYNQFQHDLRNRSLTLIGVTAKALGYSLEIGANYYPAAGLVLSLTYEMATRLDFRTAVQAGADGGGRFADGQRSRLDLPQTWRFGIGRQFTPRLRGSLGLNAYLEHSAHLDMLDDPADRIVSARDYRNTYEQSAALEYRLDPRWLLSVGLNINQIGQRRSATLDTSLPGAHNNYLSLGTGFQYQPSDRLRLNAGVAWTGFSHHYRNADYEGDQALQASFAANGVAISPGKEYDKRYLLFAFGIDYHLPF